MPGIVSASDATYCAERRAACAGGHHRHAVFEISDRSADHAGRQSRVGQSPAADHYRFHGDRDRYRAGRRGAGQWLSNNWLVAFITLLATVMFSVYLQGKGLLGMLPILFGAIFGYVVSAALGIIDYGVITNAQWFRIPAFTFPAFS